MPIYAYKCESCGYAKDVLQKMSDAPLSDCPSCGKPSFQKQVTAAGFQLKGSGWYVTDFKGGGSTAAVAPADSTTSADKGSDAAAAPAPAGASDASKTDAKPAAKTEAAPAASKPTASGT